MRIRIKLTIILIVLAVQAYPQDFTNTGISNLPPVNRSCQAFVDVNRDGLLDVFISGKENTTAHTALYLNNGDTSFSKLPAPFAELYSASASWADYNNDTWPDLLISGINISLQKICKVYKNNGDSAFTDIMAGIDSIAYGSALWADFNNDCRQDIFICGINASDQKVCHIYRNTGTGFELQNTGLPGVSSSAAVIMDYNNDGKPDILYSGLTNSGVKNIYLYRNTGHFTFQGMTSAMEKTDNGDIAAGDYDSDGDPDILLTGFNASGNRVTKLYANNAGIFMEVTTAVFEALGSGSAAFGDINSDGLMDIVITGMDDASNYQTLVYRNNGDHTFTDIGAVIQGVTLGLATPGDFNRDGDLDILISGTSDGGPLCRLYNNEIDSANTAPLPPSVISSLPEHDSVRLTWNAGSDGDTPAGGLTYNIYIGTEPARQDIFSALSGSDGFRALAAPGQQQAKTVSFSGLAQGKYYWSVQSVDNGFMGSAFAPVDSFTVCHHIFIGNDTSVCLDDTLKLSLNSPPDSVNWYSVKKGLLMADSYTLDFVVSEKDSLIAELFNSLGCIMYDTLVVEALSLPDITLGNDTAACQNSNFSLTTGSGWKQVTWYMDDTIASFEDTLSFMAGQPVTISVIVSNGPGCISYDTIELSILSLPDINLGNDTSLCYKDSIILMTGGDYPLSNWRVDGEIHCTSDTFVYLSLASKTIICEAAYGNGCTNYDTLWIETLLLPVFSLGNDTSLCFMDSIKLHPGSGWLQVEWSLNDHPYTIADSIIHFVEKTDTLGVLVTDSYHCTNRDTIVLTRLDLPVFSLGNDTAICDRSSLFLSAGTGWKNVDWYSRNEGLLEAATWFYSLTVTSPDTLWARVTNLDNCLNNDTIFIDMLPLPQFFIGRDTAICYGQPVTYSTGADWEDIDWYTFNLGSLDYHEAILSVNAFTDDVIWVKITDSNLCSNADTAQINVVALPLFDLGRDTLVCYNQTIKLNVPDTFASISWQLLQEDIVVTDTGSITLNVTGRDTIIAEIYNALGCVHYDTLIVDSLSLPRFTLAADTSICRNDTLRLSVGNNWACVDWYTLLPDQLLLRDTSGLPFSCYTQEDIILNVTVTNLAGCVEKDSIAVTVLDLPPVSAGNDTLICYNTSVLLGEGPSAPYYSPFYMYTWSPVTGLNDPHMMNPVASPGLNTVYVLQVEDAAGCLNRDSVNIRVNLPNSYYYNPVIDVCYGGDVNIGNDPLVTGSLLPYTYRWNPSASLNLADIPDPIASTLVGADYQAVVFTGNCKPDTLHIRVNVLSLPEIHTSGDITVGSREYAQLLAGGGLAYQWSPRNSLNNYDVPDPIAYPEFTTVYTVVVTDSLGCSNDTTITVTVRNDIFIPNLFTPNGDGMNDNFLIYGFGIEFLELEIYNRLGQKVYETKSVTEATQTGWDGNFNGNLMESGKYVWYIKGRYADGKELLFEGKNNGIITLVR